MRRVLFISILILAVVIAFPSRTRNDGPNVVLIVVDTLRADRLGAYGNRRGLTPFLDSLARRGTVFANAYAASSWTCPSVASLFTSRYPSQHGVVNFEKKLGESEVTLADRLLEGGYLNAGFSANFRLAADHGYAHGFGTWEVFIGHGEHPKAEGRVLREQSVAWVAKHAEAQSAAPVFLYFQYMEPHAPYLPPEPFRTRFALPSTPEADVDAANAKLTRMVYGTKGITADEVALLESLYDGEVAAVDAEIAALLGELEHSGLLQNAVVVITADHGEEFGEHGQFLHGLTLYNPSLRVPLIMAGPGVAPGRTVAKNVSLMDVAPTLVDLAGLLPESVFEGRSLVPLMSGRELADRVTSRAEAGEATGEVISELEQIGKPDWRLHSRAIIDGQEKLLVDPRGKTALYDLTSDPGESTALQGSAWAVQTADLLSRLERRQPEPSTRAAAASVPLDDATKEKLRALGYQP